MRAMIKLMFSKRHKRKVYRLDSSVNGKRFRRFFFKRSDAETAAYKIKHDEIAGKNTPGGLILHDARHTATTHMLDDGVSPKTVQEWMGWADSSFVPYYSHATKKSREEAGRSLERRFGRKTA
jgi:integrase